MRFMPLPASSSKIGLRISRDSKLKALLIALMIVTDAALIFGLGLTFPLADLVRPLLFTALIASVAWFYHCVRKIPKFVLCDGPAAPSVAFYQLHTIECIPSPRPLCPWRIVG